MYEEKNYESLLGLNGFSDELLKQHFKLYSGYVLNTNKLIKQLLELVSEEKTNTSFFAELKRRFGWEFNGMRLHELYFANLSKEKNNSDKVKIMIESSFGSFEKWKDEFESIALMRGIGWVILYYDPDSERLFNTWINEHDVGHLSGLTPLIVLDVFEHAFITDYGLDRKAYVASFFDHLDWVEVEKRIK